MVNFGEVRRAQLAKFTLLTSSLLPLVSFQDLLRFVEMLKRERGMRKATGSYRTCSSLVKLQPRFLILQWKTCLLAELQPWCLSLQRRTCPWAEHMMMLMMISYSYLQIQYIDTIHVIIFHLTTVAQIDSHQPQCKHDIGVPDSAAP